MLCRNLFTEDTPRGPYCILENGQAAATKLEAFPVSSNDSFLRVEAQGAGICPENTSSAPPHRREQLAVRWSTDTLYMLALPFTTTTGTGGSWLK